MNLIKAVGNTRGHFSHKENRAAKLISMWDELRTKMATMVKSGHGKTTSARMAYATLLMMETAIRIGNESSAEGFVCINKYHPDCGKTVQTYGLTTLLHRHVTIGDDKIVLSFTGKKLVAQELEATHPTLLNYCPKGKEDELFLNITYRELKKFQQRYIGNNYTPKDLRMAKVNLLFCEIFSSKYMDDYQAATRPARKKILSAAIGETADRIGHTKSVCKSAYLSKPLLQTILDMEF